MKSNIRLELQGNGNLINVTTESDKIYQGAVATTEYSLTIADGVSTQYAWRPTDLVWIVFERPDGLSGQFSMTRSDNGWVVTTNGWETDVDISQSAVLKISFLMKRYSTLSGGKVSEEKPTQQIDLTIHPSSGYIPQNIELEISELLQEQITQLQLDKVGRYSVSNGMLPFLPPEIVFLPDGNKTPNNIYFDFTHNIIDFDNETYEKTGVLFVQINGGVQSELFITSDKRAFVRNVGENFVPATQTDLNEFTYSKEYLENIFAGFEADIENLQDQIDSGLGDGFVTLSGDQTIMGTKTFLDSPIVPSATANPHAINRADMFDYTYSKEEINNLTTPIGFETEQNFLDWLSGTFTRPDGILPSDLLIGKKIIIQEEGKNNYQVAEVPVVDLSDFKVLVEDNKFAEEIGFKPYETINADNVQDAVEDVKDEVDLKTQIVRLDNLIIESNEWIEENGEVYFDHMIPEFTNPLEQEIEIVNNNKTQSDLFIAEQITVKAVETIGAEPNLGIRLILNKAPSETITLSVFMSNSTNITFEAGEIVAKNVFYDNTASGLIADNVQDVVDELSQKSNNISGSLIDLEDRVDDLELEIIDKADTSYVDDGLAGKADTSALSLKADKTYVDTELDLKADTTYVDAGLGLKVNNSQIVQTTGNSTTSIMSQDAVTKAIPKLYKHSFSIKGAGINNYEIDKCFATLISSSNIAISSITQLKNKLSPGEILLCNGQLRKEESGKNVFVALSHIRVQTNGDLMLHSSDIGFLVTDYLDVDNPNMSHRTSLAFSLNDTENNIDYWDVKEI